MPNGGSLTIATEDCEIEGQPAVCIAIADTGTGISADRLSRVFEPFFTTKEVGKGTGLGLSQIHGFAQQAAGRAEIESSEGEGTILRIVLPRTSKPLSEAGEEQQVAPDLPPNLQILLVEDNLQVRDFAAELLEDLKCEVVTAQNATEALQALREHDFDLVFSDVVMPGLSGVELARKIGKSRPDLPVLLATGFAGNLQQEATENFNIVTKPYDVFSLRKAISLVLAKGIPSAGDQEVRARKGSRRHH
jgi:CheY-like chemotaxis protein